MGSAKILCDFSIFIENLGLGFCILFRYKVDKLVVSSDNNNLDTNVINLLKRLNLSVLKSFLTILEKI